MLAVCVDLKNKCWPSLRLLQVFPADGDVERLEGLSASLTVAEAVRPVLERSPVVLLPQQANKQPNLPPEFFTLSKEELQKEMQLRYKLDIFMQGLV